MGPIADAREERDARAADWAARLATGPLPADRAAEMQRWLTLDPRHRGALVRAQAALAALSGRDVADPAPVASQRRGIGRRVVLAGGAACALTGAFLALRPAPVLATEIGEVRRIPLADGSTVVLDTATRLLPDFSRDARHVRLEQGHALDWREGRLELYGQTLASAVATINRYNRRPILVPDRTLAREPLHGAFRTDDPEGFARVAALSLNAHARIEPDQIVIVR